MENIENLENPENLENQAPLDGQEPPENRVKTCKKGRKKKKKRKIIVLVVCLSLALLLGTGGLVYYLQIPTVDEVYDRVVELVESSYRLNTVLYGEGLPVYAEDSTYAEIQHLYFGTSVPLGYEVVAEQYALYGSVDEIKAAAEQIYSKRYLEEIVYPAVFDGLAVQDGMGGVAYSHAKIYPENDKLYRDRDATVYLKNGLRMYDYSTMKVVYPSTPKHVIVTMNSWLPNNPSKIDVIKLHLRLQDDGLWYLDSFSG